MSLFISECRHLLKSIIYYLFILVLVLFYYSQIGGMTSNDVAAATANQSSALTMPQQVDSQSGTAAPRGNKQQGMTIQSQAVVTNPDGSHSMTIEGDAFSGLQGGMPSDSEAPYGMKTSLEPEVVMPNATRSLIGEYRDNSYLTYPVGLAKYSKLNAEEAKAIEDILTEITGGSMAELDTAWSSPEISVNQYVSKSVTFDQYRKLMVEVDELLGGHSQYAVDRLEQFGRVPITYEEALAEYHYTMEVEKITPQFARIFSDYVGIVIALFPVFVAVFNTMRDRRSCMQELVAVRLSSSVKIVVTRYLAMLCMMLLPILLLSMWDMLPLLGYASDSGLPIDLFAYVKYIFTWILPTLMMTTALGMCLTVLTDTPIAIVAQLFWWFYAINSIQLSKDYPLFGLLVRHNGVTDSSISAQYADDILTNRLVITALSLLLVALTIAFYEMKRRGKLDLGSKMAKRLSFVTNKLQADHTK